MYARVIARIEGMSWNMHSQKNRRLAFTLLELLVVTGIIAILASLTLAALSRGKQKAQGVICLNNLKQLHLAWQMYTENNEGRLPPNGDGPSAGRNVDIPAWVAGWLVLTTSSADNTDTDLLIGSAYTATGSLGHQFVGNPRVYRCPSDKSNDPGGRGSRVRSISMNGFINPGSTNGGIGTLSLNMDRNADFVKFKRMDDFSLLAPADAFVFLDEREDKINDGWFRVNMTPNTFADWPASYHNHAGGFSFADGHAEIHKWRDGRSSPPITLGLGWRTFSTPNEDTAWLQKHASVKIIH